MVRVKFDMRNRLTKGKKILQNFTKFVSNGTVECLEIYLEGF